MALRSVFGLGATLKRPFNGLPPRRCFHVSAQPRPSHDLAGYFSEIFSAHPTPDKINNLMNMIYTEAPTNTTSFSLLCRTFTDRMDRWSIKGLRVGPKSNGARRRSVVLVSGVQAYERIPIGVNLFVAAALSRNPIEGVEVTIFPVVKPKEYELEWQHEQARDFLKSSAPGAMKYSLEEDGVEGPLAGPLRSYVLKRSNNFIDVGMDLNADGSTLRLKSNSLAKPLARAEGFVQGLTTHPDFPMPRLAGPGEQTLFGFVISPPTVVLELRDKHRSLEEDQISSYGEQVLTAIQKLVADTDGPRGFVL